MQATAPQRDDEVSKCLLGMEVMVVHTLVSEESGLMWAYRHTHVALLYVIKTNKMIWWMRKRFFAKQ